MRGLPMDPVIADARQRIAQGSKSFAGASRLFAPGVRDDATMLYAWCRYCDDVIDDQTFGFANASASPVSVDDRLADLRARTQAALTASVEPEDPVFAALHRVVRAHDIPHRHPFELLEGFAMDADGRRFATIEDTLVYCYHVAGVVGVMMAMIMGARDRLVLQRASDLGIAFQLTNISRDVADDAHAGRIYLPLEWLSNAGIDVDAAVADPAMLLEDRHRAQVAAVVERLLRMAEDYYESAGYGLRALPTRSAWAVAAAKNVYREIGRKVLKDVEASLARRTVVWRPAKVWMFAAAGGEVLGAATASGQGTPQRNGLWTPPGLRAV